MPVKLVHHTPESIAGGVSPFDAAIMDIATDRDVRIACPFLGVRYLQRVIDLLLPVLFYRSRLRRLRSGGSTPPPATEPAGVPSDSRV